MCGSSMLSLQKTPSALAPAFIGDMPVEVCAGFTDSPKWQVGVSWTLLYMSYLPPLAISPYAACIDIPSYWIYPFITKFKTQYLFPP